MGRVIRGILNIKIYNIKDKEKEEKKVCGKVMLTRESHQLNIEFWTLLKEKDTSKV